MNNGRMVGSNSESSAIIFALMDIASKLGATQEMIDEAFTNREGGNDLDARRIIGLLKLIATLTVAGGGETVTVPTKTSELTNDSGFITNAVANLLNYYTKTETYTRTEVGTQISTHNTSTSAHADIRSLITGLTTRLNALADSDDTTLDQMSELVAYAKANKTLIESITTSKVSVSDIVNDLVTNVTTKPLSAAQGVALKALIDAITVPTLLSQLTGDATHRLVTDTEKSTWNAKSTFSGSYSDLTNVPTDLVKSGAITLGTHTDGLVYIFIDGEPVGTGITIPTTTE